MKLPKPARCIIKKLVKRKVKKRLGSKGKGLGQGAAAVMAHEYFEGVDWLAVYDRRHAIAWKPEKPASRIEGESDDLYA